MRVFFCTQADSLGLFYELALHMEERHGLDQAGFYVCNQRVFDELSQAHPGLKSKKTILVKDWELHAQASSQKPDLDELAHMDQRLGSPTLWDALVADSRIYLGRKAAFSQDYASRLSHEQMLSVLQVGVQRMEAAFDRLHPQLVVSFLCTTLGDYLAWRIAQSRGIPFINLRPTPLKNYIYGGGDMLEPSAQLEDEYLRLLDLAVTPDHAEAKEIAAHVRREQAGHGEEALHKTGDQAGPDAKLFGCLPRTRDDLTLNRHEDGQPSCLSLYIHRNLVKPWRMRAMRRILGPGYAQPAELAGKPFCFFPLHTEPEVSLLTNAKPWLNQIEACRILASSLPVGMRLVVKEHPGSVGMRKMGYYRKLLEIPNLVLAPPDAPAREFIKEASLVAVISGAVGLEAAILQKPVITLGRTPFNFLPDSMLRHVGDPGALGWEIRGLLAEYQHDERALLSFISAVTQSSVALNWHSRLLGRQRAHAPGDSAQKAGGEYERQLGLLADYLLKRSGLDDKRFGLDEY